VLLIAFGCATEDEMEAADEGEEQALEYIERAHDFPVMVRFRDFTV
jgi:hypothetical protein